MAVQARQQNRNDQNAAAAAEVVQRLLEQAVRQENVNPEGMQALRRLAEGVTQGDPASIRRALQFGERLAAQAAQTAPVEAPPAASTPQPSISAQLGRRQPTQPRRQGFSIPRSTTDPSLPSQMLEMAGATAPEDSQLANAVNILENIAIAAEIPRLARWTARRALPQVTKYLAKKASIMAVGSTMTPAMGAALALGSIGYDVAKAYRFFTRTGQVFGKAGRVLAPTKQAYEAASQTGRVGKFATGLSETVGTGAGFAAGAGNIGIGVSEDNMARTALGAGEIIIETIAASGAPGRLVTRATEGVRNWNDRAKAGDTAILRSEGQPPDVADANAAAAVDATPDPPPTSAVDETVETKGKAKGKAKVEPLPDPTGEYDIPEGMTPNQIKGWNRIMKGRESTLNSTIIDDAEKAKRYQKSGKQLQTKIDNVAKRLARTTPSTPVADAGTDAAAATPAATPAEESVIAAPIYAKKPETSTGKVKLARQSRGFEPDEPDPKDPFFQKEVNGRKVFDEAAYERAVDDYYGGRAQPSTPQDTPKSPVDPPQVQVDPPSQMPAPRAAAAKTYRVYEFEKNLEGSGFDVGDVGKPKGDYLPQWLNAAKAQNISEDEAKEMWRLANVKMGSPEVKAQISTARQTIRDGLGSNPWTGGPWTDAQGLTKGAREPGRPSEVVERARKISDLGGRQRAFEERAVQGDDRLVTGAFETGSLREGLEGLDEYGVSDILAAMGGGAAPQKLAIPEEVSEQVFGTFTQKLVDLEYPNLAEMFKLGRTDPDLYRFGDQLSSEERGIIEGAWAETLDAVRTVRVPSSTSNIEQVMRRGGEGPPPRDRVRQRKLATGVNPRDTEQFQQRLEALTESLKREQPNAAGWNKIRKQLTDLMKDMAPSSLPMTATRFADKRALGAEGSTNVFKWQKDLLAGGSKDLKVPLDVPLQGMDGIFKLPQDMIAEAVLRSQAQVEAQVRTALQNVFKRDMPKDSPRGQQQITGQDTRTGDAEVLLADENRAYTDEMIENFMGEFFAKTPWKEQVRAQGKGAAKTREDAPYAIYTHPVAGQLFRLQWSNNVLAERMAVIEQVAADSPPNVRQSMLKIMETAKAQQVQLFKAVGEYAAALTHPLDFRRHINPVTGEPFKGGQHLKGTFEEGAPGRYIAGTLREGTGTPYKIKSGPDLLGDYPPGTRTPSGGHGVTGQDVRLVSDRPKMRKTVRFVSGDPEAIPAVTQDPADLLRQLSGWIEETRIMTQNQADNLDSGLKLYSGMMPFDTKEWAQIGKVMARSPQWAGGTFGGISGGMLGSERAEQEGHTGLARGVDILGGAAIGFGTGYLTGSGITKTAPGPALVGGVSFKPTGWEKFRALHLYMLLSANALWKAAGGAHMAGYLRAAESGMQGSLMRLEGRMTGNDDLVAAGRAEIQRGKAFGGRIFKLQKDLGTSLLPKAFGGTDAAKSEIRQVFGLNPDNPEDLQKLINYSAAPNMKILQKALGEEALARQLTANWLGRGFRAGDWPMHKAMVDVYGPEAFEEARNLSLTGTFSTKFGQSLYDTFGSGTHLKRAREEHARAINPSTTGRLPIVTDPKDLPSMAIAGVKDAAKQFVSPVPRVVLQQAEQLGRYLFAPAVRLGQDLFRFAGGSKLAQQGVPPLLARRLEQWRAPDRLRKAGESMQQGLDALAPRAGTGPLDEATTRARNITRLGMGTAGLAAGAAGASAIDDRLGTGTLTPLAGHLSGPFLLGKTIKNVFDTGATGLDIPKQALQGYVDESLPYSRQLLNAAGRFDFPGAVHEAGRQMMPAATRMGGNIIDPEIGRQTSFGALQELARREPGSLPVASGLGRLGASIAGPILEAGLASRTILPPREPAYNPITGETQRPLNAFEKPITFGQDQPAASMTPGETVSDVTRRLLTPQPQTSNPVLAAAALGRDVMGGLFAPETLRSTNISPTGRDRSALLLARQGRMTADDEQIAGLQRPGAFPGSSGYETDEHGRPLSGVTPAGRRMAHFTAAAPTREMYMALKQVELHDPEYFAKLEQNPLAFRGWLAGYRDTATSPQIDVLREQGVNLQQYLGADKPAPQTDIPVQRRYR
jgi:hypothetical protein